MTTPEQAPDPADVCSCDPAEDDEMCIGEPVAEDPEVLAAFAAGEDDLADEPAGLENPPAGGA